MGTCLVFLHNVCNVRRLVDDIFPLFKFMCIYASSVGGGIYPKEFQKRGVGCGREGLEGPFIF